MVKAYVHTIVAPAMDYWKQTIEGKKGGMKTDEDSAYFQPASCLGQQDFGVRHRWMGLRIFKFCEDHQIRVQIEVMQTEFMRY